MADSTQQTLFAVPDSIEPQKRKRGRPRKDSVIPQPPEVPEPIETAPVVKRTQGGGATSDVVVSASVGLNSELFKDILDLHVPRGSLVADVTYGKGVFWKLIEKDSYQLRFSDLDAKTDHDINHDVPVNTGVDARNLPFEAASLDCLVFDPPYQEGLLRKNTDHLGSSGTHLAFRHHYSNGKAQPLIGASIATWQLRANLERHPVILSDDSKWHDTVLALYVKGGLEGWRVLRQDGLFIVKCQDEVSANKQRLTHVEIITAYESMGFYCKDLFILVRNNKPGVSSLKDQRHARKNHSYFLVFKKVRKQQVANGVILQPQ
ncbi:site-specific DNA-methyltransferase [Deinococcus marmoris]|uniref:site-specific DNA-methyltransferase n=1 Tax=Deinococcus marmoris TaxID=249408 RepID=UPI000AA8DAF4|nr:site-specific DNA-methyltransferase [Deinococcus marmoris]